MQKGKTHIITVFLSAIFVGLTIILVSVGTHIKTKIALSAEEYTIQQITNNFNSKGVSDIDDGRFVWNEVTERNNNFLFDNNNVVQITDYKQTEYNASGAKIDGDYVTWARGDVDNTLFAYKISTGETIQLTSDPAFLNSAGPEISDGKIVWHRYKKGPSCCTEEIILYDLASSTLEQLTDDLAPALVSDANPVIDGNTIVWVRGNGGDQLEIFKKDLITGQVDRLTNNTFHDTAPTISEGKIAWQGFDGNDWEIFLYDNGVTRQITSNNTLDVNPQLVGNKLVWNGWKDIYMNFPEIYIYDILNSSTETISDALLPYTDGIKVAWIKRLYGGVIGGRDIWYRNVFVKNTFTGEVTQVTNDGYVLERNPFLHGNLIVWVSDNPTEPYMGPNIFIAFQGNTPAGENVVVSENNAILTFSQVEVGGDTTITTSASGTQPPTGFKLGNPPAYYNISTTAVFSGTVEVCINYDENTIVGNESQLKLMHFVDGQGWVDSTTSLDTANNVICGNVTSFSDFAVMTEPTIPDLITRIKEMNLRRGIEKSLNAKLSAAQRALDVQRKNGTKTAVKLIKAFINKVEAQRGNKLTNEQADELHSFADNLIKIIQGIKQF